MSSVVVLEEAVIDGSVPARGAGRSVVVEVGGVWIAMTGGEGVGTTTAGGAGRVLGTGGVGVVVVETGVEVGVGAVVAAGVGVVVSAGGGTCGGGWKVDPRGEEEGDGEGLRGAHTVGIVGVGAGGSSVLSGFGSS